MRTLISTCVICISAIIISCKGNSNLLPSPKDSSKKDSIVKSDSPVKVDVKTLTTAELLQRDWRISDVFPKEDDTSFIRMKNTTVIKFTADQVVVMTEGSSPQPSSYILSANGKDLLIKANDKYEENVIEEISKDKLVITSKKDNARVTMIPVN